MLYCAGYTVSFQEVPDEVSLVLLIADCPHSCKGCHSPNLRKPEGFDLENCINDILDEYGDAITCVCFMGEGRDPPALLRCNNLAKKRGYKTAIYSGFTNAWQIYMPYFDYYKCGPYIEAKGGLDNPNTNQFMLRLKVVDGDWTFDDITYRFQRSND